MWTCWRSEFSLHKRYLKLLSIYKTINNLKKANVEEISIKIGIPRSLSEDILRKLNAK